MAVTSSATAQVTLPTDTQIRIEREFDAPRALVWRAYTTPELVARWWAGRRGKVTSVEIDLRVGGRWRYVMVAGEGFEVAFHGEYREIAPEERLVTTEVYEGAGPDAEAALVTTTFRADGDRTAMEQVIEVSSREVRDMIIATGMEGGMQESYDALESVAAGLTGSA
jgi:uncharacterized protein YndB with AHSA1/START domain